MLCGTRSAARSNYREVPDSFGVLDLSRVRAVEVGVVVGHLVEVGGQCLEIHQASN